MSPVHVQAIDPSGFRPNRRNRSASSPRPCFTSRSVSRRAYLSPASARARSPSRSPRLASRSASRRAASHRQRRPGRAVRPGRRARPAARSAVRRHPSPTSARARSLVEVALLGQQVGQLHGGFKVAGVGPGAQIGQVAGVGQTARPAKAETKRRRRPGRAAPSRSPSSASSPASGRRRPSPTSARARRICGLVQVASLGQQPGQQPGGSRSPASARARSPSRSPRSASSSASSLAAAGSPASAGARRICTASSRSPRSASSSASSRAACGRRHRPGRAGSAGPSRSPRSASSQASRQGGIPVAGVGPGAQPASSVAALGQQLGEPHGGFQIAGVGPGAQYCAPLSGPRSRPAVRPATRRHAGRRRRRGRAECSLFRVAALGQQPGQLPRGMSGSPSVGGVTVELDGVAVQQPFLGAVSEPGGVGGVADVAEDGIPGAGGHARHSGVPG